MPALRQDNIFILLEVVGVVLLLDQATLLLPEILPAQPGQPFWRYGVFGLIIGRAAPMLFADALILFAAYRLGQVRFLRVAGILHLFLALLLLLGLALFGLDTVQVRRQLKPEFQRGMLMTAGRAMAMTVALSAFAVWAGIRLYVDGGRRAGRPPEEARGDRFLITREVDVANQAPQ